MMMDGLIPGEEKLFFLINGAHTYLDCMMWVFSSIKIWIPLAAFILLNIAYKRSWRQYLPIFMLLVLLFFVCDQFSSHLIKPLVARPRPTHYPGIMEHVKILFDYTGGRYGFISGHATNSFGFAVFSALLFKNRCYSFVVFSWAAIVAYSRIYLGVHFISDILGGMVSGLLIGYLVYGFYLFIIKKISTGNDSFAIAAYSLHRVRLLTIGITFYLILITTFSTYIATFLLT
ncbi:MAG: phosphatase PAP2 family protein [Mediterranea sp.]|jgi:undecaprenyl-diphosphatase|nr:phosphatase PAP2 family protein [Mediterranea sp.]